MSPPSRRSSLLAIYSGRDLHPNVRALGATSFLQDVASEMVYPLLPTFLLGLGGGAALLGGMEAAAAAVLALVKGSMGPVSDRVGRRKPFVVAGYGLSALTRPLMAVALWPFHVVGLRILDRAAKGIRTAPRDALIAESTVSGQRAYAFAFHRGLDHLGAALGPLLAALILLLAPGRLRLVFALATVPAVAGWLVVASTTRETATVEAQRAVTAGFHRQRVPTKLLLPLAAFFLFSLGNASDAFILLRGAGLGMTPVALTLLWSGFHIVKWLASAPAGRLADRFGPGRLVLLGWGLYAAVYVGFAMVKGSLALLAIMGVYAFHDALTEGAEKALVVRLGGGGLGAGSILGAYHLASGIGVFVASILFGLLWEAVSPAAAFGLGAALALVAVGMMGVALRRASA